MLWNIRKIVHKGDYNYALVPEHPNATEHGYVLEHRVVMENYIGRLIRDDEEVHHKNRNRYDNRLENLVLVNKHDHVKYHGYCNYAKHMVLLRCPNCGKEFSLEKRNSFISKHTNTNCNFCSRHCNGQFSRKTQIYGGLTPEMEEAVNNCFIKEYKMLTPYKLNYIVNPIDDYDNNGNIIVAFKTNNHY